MSKIEKYGQSLEPKFVGPDFPSKRPFNKDRYLLSPDRLPIHPTIEQSLRPVYPSFIDFGMHTFEWGEFPSGTTHVSFALAEQINMDLSDQALVQREVNDTNRYHREFGWDSPQDADVFTEIGQYLLSLSRKHMDWGEYTDRPLLINMELIRTNIPILEEDRYAYDELLHSDAVDQLWPVAQVFWADVLHSNISMTPAFIGEAQESFAHAGAMNSFEPTNVFYSEGAYYSEQLPVGHLVIADSKRLPHGRPNLAILKKSGQPGYRHYLRSYIAPLQRKSDVYPSAKSLAQIGAFYGQDFTR